MTPLVRLSAAEVDALPPFAGPPLERIVRVVDRGQEAFVESKLAETGIIGFDTESKPVFSVGEVSGGPHLIQLATLDHAFLFQVQQTRSLRFLRHILESQHVLKVGFSLSTDISLLKSKLNIDLRRFVDLTPTIGRMMNTKAVGTKAAVAMVLGQCLPKLKKLSRSNWALFHLTEAQQRYAADDAVAALAVYLALGCPKGRRVAAGPNPSLKPSPNGVAPGPAAAAAILASAGPGTTPSVPA